MKPSDRGQNVQGERGGRGRGCEAPGEEGEAENSQSKYCSQPQHEA